MTNYFEDSGANYFSQDWLNNFIPLFVSIPHPVILKSNTLYSTATVGVRDAFEITFDDFGFCSVGNPFFFTVNGVTFSIVVSSEFTGLTNQINSDLNNAGTAFLTGNWSNFAIRVMSALGGSIQLKNKIFLSFGYGANVINNLKLCSGADATTVIDNGATPHLIFYIVGAEIGVPISVEFVDPNINVLQVCFASYGSARDNFKMFAQVQLDSIQNFDGYNAGQNGKVNLPLVFSQPNQVLFNIETAASYPTLETANRLFAFDFAKMIGNYMKPPEFYIASTIVFESWRNCTVNFGTSENGNGTIIPIGADGLPTPLTFFAVEFYIKENQDRAYYDLETDLIVQNSLAEFKAMFLGNIIRPFFTSQKKRIWVDTENCGIEKP